MSIRKFNDINFAYYTKIIYFDLFQNGMSSEPGILVPEMSSETL